MRGPGVLAAVCVCVLQLSVVACRTSREQEHLVMIPVAPSSERPRPIVAEPPVRARDDEADAFRKGDQSPQVDLDDGAKGQSFHATARPVECPMGAQWTGSVCRVTEVSCPSRSQLVGSRCIGEVKCPDESAWDGRMCRPRAVLPAVLPVDAGPSQRASPGPPDDGAVCHVNFNTIPASEVFVDGTALGPTPRIRVVLNAGRHVVLFVAGQMAKKSISFTCSPGEAKSVVAKLFE
jgi:hypothetical protein